MDWAYLADNTSYITSQFLQHVMLTVVSVGAGFLIAFPLGLVAINWPRLYTPILSITGILFTIPSLGLFVLLIPLPFMGLSVTTPLTGLTVFTLLVLTRNVVEGFRGVPREVRDAATAMGYRPGRRLLRVELPLALPVIIAGLRITTVTIISLVTVTALIGFGGVGRLFLDGFTFRSPTPIVVGIVLSVLLAVVADLLLVSVQWVLTPWRRGR